MSKRKEQITKEKLERLADWEIKLTQINRRIYELQTLQVAILDAVLVQRLALVPGQRVSNETVDLAISKAENIYQSLPRYE